MNPYPTEAYGRRSRPRCFVVLTLVGTLIVACGENQPPGGDTMAGTMWEMTAVWDGAALAPSNPTTIATLTFAGDAASGSTGCNLFRSTYAIDGDSIVLGDLALTGAECDPDYVGQESAMVRAMQASRRFAKSNDRLDLIDAKGTIQLQFRPADELPLAGITWRLVWYGGGNSPLDRTEISLAFDPAGTLTGVAGCNGYSADYQVDDDQLIIGALVQTEQMCREPDGVMEQEAEYLSTLGQTDSFATTLIRLELFGADGATIAQYRFAGRIRSTESG